MPIFLPVLYTLHYANSVHRIKGNYLRVQIPSSASQGMSDAFTAKRQQLSRQSHSACSTTAWCLKLALTVMFFGWSLVIVRHVSGRAPLRAADSVSGGSRAASNRSKTALRIKVNDPNPLRSVPFEETDESYHLVFSTGCSEFQDWQSIGVYSSAQAVGQRGIITRIASGCSESQQAALRHAMAHLPKRCRIHFAPSTDVKDHAGHFYKYANKPLGLMHWLIHADPKVLAFLFLSY